MSNLTTNIPAARLATSVHSVRANPRSSSIPIEMKKRLLKLSLNGEISERIWWAYSDSDSASPARNAPSASESPRVEQTPGHTQAEKDCGDEEDLLVAHYCNTTPKKGEDVAANQQNQTHHGQCFSECQEDGKSESGTRRCECGKDRHHRDHDQVLEEQDAKDDPAMWTVQLLSFVEQF